MKTIVTWSNDQLKTTNHKNDQIITATSAEASGFNPVELLTSALGSCIVISIKKLLDRDGIKFQEKDLVVIVHALKAEKGPSRIEQFSVEINLTLDLEEKYRKRLIKSAERACTVGNTLKTGTTITYIDRRDE